jgi:hypothetical protein
VKIFPIILSNLVDKKGRKKEREELVKRQQEIFNWILVERQNNIQKPN